MFHAVATAVFVGVMVIAAGADLRTRRIPNAVTLGGLAAGLLVGAAGGVPTLVAALTGAGLAFAIALPLFLLRALGGGDAKLFLAAGAFLGPAGFLQGLLMTAILGGVLAAMVIVRNGVLAPALASSGRTLKYLMTLGRAGARPDDDPSTAMTVPYGVAIALGSVWAWFV